MWLTPARRTGASSRARTRSPSRRNAAARSGFSRRYLACASVERSCSTGTTPRRSVDRQAWYRVLGFGCYRWFSAPVAALEPYSDNDQHEGGPPDRTVGQHRIPAPQHRRRRGWWSGHLNRWDAKGLHALGRMSSPHPVRRIEGGLGLDARLSRNCPYGALRLSDPLGAGGMSARSRTWSATASLDIRISAGRSVCERLFPGPQLDQGYTITQHPEFGVT
jgi:hypothetical protein